MNPSRLEALREQSMSRDVGVSSSCLQPVPTESKSKGKLKAGFGGTEALAISRWGNGHTSSLDML